MKNRSFQASIISVFVGLMICGIKFAAYLYTDSSAILSDALESIINVVAAVFASYSIHMSNQAADQDHLYGHDRMEYFSGGAEGALILLAGVVIFLESIWKWIEGAPIKQLEGGIFLIAIGSLLNGALGLYLIRTGKKNGSVALEADGHHVITDFFTSIGLLVGLAMVYYTGHLFLDSLLAMGMAIWIVINGFRILRGNFNSLMDRVDPLLLNRFSNAMNKLRYEEMIHLHRLRIRETGMRTLVDFHVIMPFFLNVQEVHEIEVGFTNRLKEELKREIDLMMHTDPCIAGDCSMCMRDQCGYRTMPYKKSQLWSTDDMITDVEHPFSD